MDLNLIDTIIVVLMENRSFDHMLGSLALPADSRRADGISLDDAWVKRTTNEYNGKSYAPWHMTDGSLIKEQLGGDPPHERDDTKVQIADDYPWATGQAPMNGFVANYASVSGLDPGEYAEVVGYYTRAEAPITYFLADNFAVCDSWYACLPTSTWPNRLMAMAGFTMTDNTIGDFIPDQHLVYDWLDARNVKWRVYHEGWPIFTLMPRMLPDIMRDAVLQERFRSFSRFATDFASKDPFPQVVFIEPKYTPDHYSSAMNSDDHAPSSIAGGQLFLRSIYTALMSNPERWRKTVMIVAYDENGGFFDHRSPLPIRTDPPRGNSWKNPQPFLTTGIRVPALVVSPLVEPKAIFSEPLDHSCILKFLGQKFGGANGYSPQVDGRKDIDRNSLSDLAKVLARTTPRGDRPSPPHYNPVSSKKTTRKAVGRKTAFEQAFDNTAQNIRNLYPNEGSVKFPGSAW